MIKCTLLVFAVLLTEVVQAAVKEEEVTFYLFTRRYSDDPIQLDEDNSNDYLDHDAQIVFLIHGWTQNWQHFSMQMLKDAYLSRRHKNYNVIAVDFAEAAAQPYYKAVHDSVKVGEFIGDFIVHMKSKGASLRRFHLVGHSLGAHVAGYAGKRVYEKLDRKVHRITALDPAGPFFQGLVIQNPNRLTKHDADVVFVLHTDRTMFGVRTSIGTIDVYPNGGGNQPGCPDYYRGEIFFCSHHRSYELFADALENPGSVMATKCSSYANYVDGMCKSHRKIDVGSDFTRDDDGEYYLRTHGKKPYGRELE